MNIFIFVLTASLFTPVGHRNNSSNLTNEKNVYIMSAKAAMEDTLHYDGNQLSSLGLYEASSDTYYVFYTGVRFTPMAAESLIAVSFFFFTGTHNDVTLYIYGNGNTTTPGTELANKNFTVTSGDSTWNRIDLTTPIFCDAETDFWAVIKSQGAIGLDAGPIAADRGGFLSQDGGSTWEQLSTYSFNKNWNIRAILRNYTAIEENKPLKNDFAISYSNNPIKTNFSVSYSVPNTMNVKINLFDLTGRLVQTLEDRTLGNGTYTKTISTESLGTGIYFCNVEAGNFRGTKKVVVVK
ncbi:MAG: T9SS type A sorting domain-containing protein [bacterium]|nr:T9SS type A sorting domain-containing protein [bacterium]